MRKVHGGEQVCLKHQTHTHCIPPQRSGVDRCPQRILRCKTHKNIVKQMHSIMRYKLVWRSVALAVHTCSLRRRVSMGMTLRMGSSTIKTFGLLFTKQHFSMSQSAPSRYRPDRKQPAGNETVSLYNYSLLMLQVKSSDYYPVWVFRRLHPHSDDG